MTKKTRTILTALLAQKKESIPVTNPEDLGNILDTLPPQEEGDDPIILDIETDVTPTGPSGEEVPFEVGTGNIVLESQGTSGGTISGGSITTSLVVSGANTIVTLGQGITVSGGNAGNGGGIIVKDGATLIIDGAIIENNVSTNNSYGEGGGAVNIYSGTCIMNSGIIRNNLCLRGAGVYVTGITSKFIMNGGIVENNSNLILNKDTGEIANYSGAGGGLFSYRGGQIEVNGGIIRGNKSARLGSAICASEGVSAHPSIVINGGLITGNIGPHAAIGLASTNTKATMTGGIIENNIIGLSQPDGNINTSWVSTTEATTKYFPDTLTRDAFSYGHGSGASVVPITWTGGTINGQEST